MNKIYWDNFYKIIKPFDFIEKLFNYLKNNKIKIAILTNFISEHQFEKLSKLKLLKYVDVLVTSEEIGIEKPDKKMYETILNKLNMKSNEVIMIGDSFKSDIEGAIKLNIYAGHFVNFNLMDKKYFSFSSIENLYNLIKDYNNSINDLISLCNIYGERFDLTQAGGGNTSVKVDDIMFIKASGFHLTQVTEKSGFVPIQNNMLKNDILLNKLKPIVSYNFTGSLRGSIETYMHAILKKYTVHLHPIQVNKILISKQCEDFIKKFFPNSLLIEYDTPGINVCNKIMSVYNNEEIIFLKNHGIIITTNDYDTLIPTLESLLNIFETNLQINVDKYKYVNQISKYVNKNYENVSYLCEDKIINQYLHDKRQLFQEKITFPDALIFCGVKVLFIDYLQDIENYFEIYKEYPKVIVINDLVYIINISLQKCKDTEDVLKGNLMILDNNMEKTYLTNEEICYLNNWDAEKYRKNL